MNEQEINDRDPVINDLVEYMPLNTNQIIHERLMGGECYHDSRNDTIDGDYYFVQCSKCLATRPPHEDWKLPIYTQDLNLAFAAQAKAIERFGEHYLGALMQIVGADYIGEGYTASGLKLVEADAAARCAAIVKLLENENA